MNPVLAAALIALTAGAAAMLALGQLTGRLAARRQLRRADRGYRRDLGRRGRRNVRGTIRWQQRQRRGGGW